MPGQVLELLQLLAHLLLVSDCGIQADMNSLQLLVDHHAGVVCCFDLHLCGLAARICKLDLWRSRKDQNLSRAELLGNRIDATALTLIVPKMLRCMC